MEIFVNNIKIPILEKISIKILNPLFNDIGTHSYPISFNPKLPEVKLAFGFAGKIESDPPRVVPGRIRSGLFDISGEWQITEAGERIEAYFKSDVGNFYSLISGVKLTELSYGGIKYPVGVLSTVMEYMNTVMSASWPTSEYIAFSAYMPNAYGSETTADEKLVNDTEWDINGNPSFKADSANNTVYLFVGTVLDYLFAEYGYQINKNIFLSNSELKKLVIFNCYNRKGSVAFDYTQLVPDILISEFLRALMNRFGISFIINENNKSVDIISFNDIVGSGVNNLSCKFLAQPLIDNRRSNALYFPLNAPDEWSSHEYLETDNIFFNATVVSKVRDIPVDVWSTNEFFYVKSENAYYTVVYNLIDLVYELKRVCPNNFSYYSGSNGVEIEQNSGIPGMYTYVKEYTYLDQYQESITVEIDFVMPRIDLEVKDDLNPDNNFPLMFLRAEGVSQAYIEPAEGAPENIGYPFATNGLYESDGSAISGASMNLNWSATNGIIEAFWLNRIYFETEVKRKVKAPISSSDINLLKDFTKPVRIENNNYLVNSLEIEIDENGVDIPEAEFFRL